jgi:hypothetical protein
VITAGFMPALQSIFFDLWIVGLLMRWFCQLLLSFSSWQECCWFMRGCSYWLDMPVIATNLLGWKDIHLSVAVGS